jgi:hypothetical protein
MKNMFFKTAMRWGQYRVKNLELWKHTNRRDVTSGSNSLVFAWGVRNSTFKSHAEDQDKLLVIGRMEISVTSAVRGSINE